MSLTPEARKSSAGFAVRRTPPRSRRRLALRLGSAVALACVLAGGGWWLWHAPVFALRTVESGAYRYTDQAQLEKVFGTFLGRNIWAVSTADVADSMATLPWVKDLTVHKRLPGSLEVDFREWRPILGLAAEKGRPARVVVEDGQVLDFPDHLVPPGLPVLLGVGTEADTLGTTGLRLVAEHRSNVLELQAAMEETGLERVCPVDFVVARDTGYVIVLQDDRGTLVLGREEFARRLARFMDARDHLEEGLQMDLRFADRITCRRL